MNYILFDGDYRANLLPLTFTRPVADIRFGITTIREKWEFYLNSKTSTLTEVYLSKKYPTIIEMDNILINSSVIPTLELCKAIHDLEVGQLLKTEKLIIAARVDDEFSNSEDCFTGLEQIMFKGEFDIVENSWDIFSMADKYIRQDFDQLTKNRKSQDLSSTNFVRGDSNQIFIEEGATVEFAFLNSESGPIYIAKDAEIMESSKIRGPFALGEHSAVKMGAKIYGATSIGPHCKVGGEINNSVIFAYSNKGHDGFLGNAVLGEWCNLGADTNNSNLKNNYEEVRLWSYADTKFVKTGLQFCGLIMGDHSKTGINTMLNTGTVIGVSCNIYGSGFQRNFIPSFSWGSPLGMKAYNLSKAITVAESVYKRRSLDLDKNEQNILAHIHKLEQD